jgi:hypothetical protein
LIEHDTILATRSGRIVRPPNRIQEFSALALMDDNEILMLEGDSKFESIEESNVMNYKTTIKSNKGKHEIRL